VLAMKPVENGVKIDPLEKYRKFLKSDLWEELDKIETDQRKGVPAPPPQKPYREDARLIALVSPEDFAVGKMPLIEAIERRKSRRQYSEEPLTLEELSFLLWATQGIRKITTRDTTKELRARAA
jgi:hypothetical protein